MRFPQLRAGIPHLFSDIHALLLSMPYSWKRPLDLELIVHFPVSSLKQTFLPIRTFHSFHQSKLFLGFFILLWNASILMRQTLRSGLLASPTDENNKIGSKPVFFRCCRLSFPITVTFPLALDQPLTRCAVWGPAGSVLLCVLRLFLLSCWF